MQRAAAATLATGLHTGGAAALFAYKSLFDNI